jgi:HEAT repeat protein
VHIERSLTGSTKEIRLEALDSLTEEYDSRVVSEQEYEKVISALEVLIKDEDDDIRAKAVALLFHTHDSRAEDYLYEFFEDRNPQIRVIAVQSVIFGGGHGKPDLRKRVEAMLDDQDENVREYTAYALTSIGNADTIRKLINYAKREKSQKVAQAMDIAIARLSEKFSISK